MTGYESWGRAIPSTPRRVVPIASDPNLAGLEPTILPRGLGRSYGDVCLNNGATLLDATPMARILSFDAARGILECEAGASIEQILRVIVPQGWFLPVTPGTKFVTIGGCIANDIHGKNHHDAGTFGHHVRSLTLLRSDREMIVCSADREPELFHATIGGLGLTGLIVSAEIALRRIESASVTAETLPFRTLEEFAELSSASDRWFSHTVAWFDSLSGRNMRGVFFRGRHAKADEGAPLASYAPKQPRVLPMRLASPFLNRASVRAFNRVYHAAHARGASRRADFDSFFFPLDGIANWNLAYGKRGFVQYQCVIPEAAGLQPVAEILDRTSRAGIASFLTVIKRFGEAAPAGLLSFPRAGITLALDFPLKYDRTLPLLEELDTIVLASNGALYPAKDARMPPSMFQASFPRLGEFTRLIDPRFSSSFWRRMMSS